VTGIETDDDKTEDSDSGIWIVGALDREMTVGATSRVVTSSS
jgi:hypothetical protein